jgi:tRNA(fMet)-specific endonuclease VapC
MAYLIDTCIWIHHLKNPGGVIESRLESVPTEEIRTCSVVKGELWTGARGYGNSERRMALLQQLFLPFQSHPFDDFAAWEYGRIRYELEQQGKVIGPNDLKIAAIALHYDLTVITTNTNEFRRVVGLKVEDWTV